MGLVPGRAGHQPLGHLLHVGQHVAAGHGELARVGPQRLVLRQRHGDEALAILPSALTQDPDVALGGCGLMGVLDLLVDLAGRRLVAGGPLLSAPHLFITAAELTTQAPSRQHRTGRPPCDPPTVQVIPRSSTRGWARTSARSSSKRPPACSSSRATSPSSAPPSDEAATTASTWPSSSNCCPSGVRASTRPSVYNSTRSLAARANRWTVGAGSSPSGVVGSALANSSAAPDRNRSGGGWPQLTSRSSPRRSNSARTAVTKSSSPSRGWMLWFSSAASSTRLGWVAAARKLASTSAASCTASRPLPLTSPTSTRRPWRVTATS